MENRELARLLDLEEWSPNDEKIALNLKEEERIYLAKHIKKYDGIIIDLSYDRSTTVREAVASNINTPINILRRLSTSDKCKTVKDISNSTLKELGK
ncbi:hypothetical protein ORD22_05675 [Sporosarcina sp. GW1-11]|uniref:hypothetical protein n=1 Tax=Sporosarcina sp. GW1-11 TaxID=2899126 RepID=UPI00294FCEB1|nr:hypothetical protein [Sporosarcina sp. GW1-11]MDV6377752.1 hypothetical protein [Sporosarcina sp. GW1-11]